MNEKWVADEIMALKKGDSKTHASTHGNSGSDRVTLDTSQITSGQFDVARIPTGDTSSTVCVGNDSRLSDARTPTSHNHAATEITSGTMDIARIPTGTTSSTVCLGNDSRLSDARTPTSHSHSYSDLPIASTSSRGCVQVGSGLSISNGVLSASSGGSITPIFDTDSIYDKGYWCFRLDESTGPSYGLSTGKYVSTSSAICSGTYSFTYIDDDHLSGFYVAGAMSYSTLKLTVVDDTTGTTLVDVSTSGYNHTEAITLQKNHTYTVTYYAGYYDARYSRYYGGDFGIYYNSDGTTPEWRLRYMP